jgi:hypothetical protein
MSCRHLGIILTVLGTVFLAFSVRIIPQYGGPIGEAVERARQRDPKLFTPTETRIIRPLFWAGLGLIGIGAALQW